VKEETTETTETEETEEIEEETIETEKEDLNQTTFALIVEKQDTGN
jgi:hypothetical protein